MKITRTYFGNFEIQFPKFLIMAGVSTHSFGLKVDWDKQYYSIQIGPFYIGVEW